MVGCGGRGAYMKIGSGGRALIRGGSKHYAGGTIDDLYKAGAVRNIAAFHLQIATGKFANETVRMGVAIFPATILAREACLRKGRMPLDELRKENRKLEVDLTGLKS